MGTHYKLATGIIEDLYAGQRRIDVEGCSMVDVAKTLHPVGLAALVFACDPEDLADEGDYAAFAALALGAERGGAFGEVEGVQAVVREISARDGWEAFGCSLHAMVDSLQILRQGGVSHEDCSICGYEIWSLRVVVARAGAWSYRVDVLDWIDRAIDVIVERFDSKAVRAQSGVIARREARKTEAALAKMREASFRLSDAPSLEARIAALEARLAEADALIAALRASSAPVGDEADALASAGLTADDAAMNSLIEGMIDERDEMVGLGMAAD